MHKRMSILSLGLALTVLGACGGDDETITDTQELEGGGGGGTMMREGPEGCYLVAEMRCDCELEEADCTDEDIHVWTEGCSSCED